MNRLVRVLTVAGLLAVGGVAIATAPSDDTIVAPFLVRGEIGKPIGSRLATVVVSDVGVARELDLSYAYDPDFGEPAPDTASAGVWIVVSLDVTATYTSIDFGNAEVRIAGVRYRASTVLPDPDLPTFAFDPGVTVRGSIVFELPADDALRLEAHAVAVEGHGLLQVVDAEGDEGDAWFHAFALGIE